MGDLHAISSYGPTAPSTRVRLLDWFRFLGIEATHHCYAGLKNNRPHSIATHPAAIAHAEFVLRRLDLTGQRVVISREVSPFSRGTIEENLLRSAAHGVYDFDDALFDDDDQSPIRRLLGTLDKFRRAAAAADVVIAGNDYLADWAGSYSDDVRVIPSCIDPRDYSPKADWSIAGDVPAMVWLGSPSSEHYLAQIAPALLETNRRTGALLTVISGPNRNPILDPLGSMIRRVPWKINTFASVLSSADMAIAPLDDEPYSQGKCAYKLLQYAATGLPIVGAPVGGSRLALRRFDGLEVQSVDDWIHGLQQVATDSASRRADRGSTARASVEAHYSFDSWKSKWCDATGVTEADRMAPKTID